MACSGKWICWLFFQGTQIRNDETKFLVSTLNFGIVFNSVYLNDPNPGLNIQNNESVILPILKIILKFESRKGL